MNIKFYAQASLLVLIITLFAACTKMPGRVNGEDDDQAATHGLGKLNRFAGQLRGEYYTTFAPHNQTLLFAYDDSTVDSKYFAALNAQATYLKKHLGARILLAGHTDERGSREYNIALGERRANAVATLMRLSGILQQQLRIVSYGKERPANLGHTETAHMQNRRVELIYEATR